MSPSNKFELEAVGIPVYGPEEDYFQESKDLIGINSLLKRAGVDGITWQVATAFEFAHHQLSDDDYLTWQEYKEEYIKTTGRKIPPIYKVKFVIEAEECTEEETEKYWKEYGER